MFHRDFRTNGAGVSTENHTTDPTSSLQSDVHRFQAWLRGLVILRVLMVVILLAVVDPIESLSILERMLDAVYLGLWAYFVAQLVVHCIFQQFPISALWLYNCSHTITKQTVYQSPVLVRNFLQWLSGSSCRLQDIRESLRSYCRRHTVERVNRQNVFSTDLSISTWIFWLIEKARGLSQFIGSWIVESRFFSRSGRSRGRNNGYSSVDVDDFGLELGPTVPHQQSLQYQGDKKTPLSIRSVPTAPPRPSMQQRDGVVHNVSKDRNPRFAREKNL